MAIQISKEIEFIPDSEKGSKKPTTFYLKPLGHKVKRKHSKRMHKFLSTLNFKAAADGDTSASVVRYEDDTEQMFEELEANHIVRIENLEVDGKAIKNGKDFVACDCIPESLAMEVDFAIMSAGQLLERDSKN